jgi:hypothetical protein
MCPCHKFDPGNPHADMRSEHYCENTNRYPVLLLLSSICTITWPVLCASVYSFIQSSKLPVSGTGRLHGLGRSKPVSAGYEQRVLTATLEAADEALLTENKSGIITKPIWWPAVCSAIMTRRSSAYIWIRAGRTAADKNGYGFR